MTQLYEGFDGDDAVHQEVGISYDELQELREACNSTIEIAKAAERLFHNEDFQTVIHKGYMGTEPQRLAGLLVSGKLTDKEADEVVKDLKSIGSLNTFLSLAVQKGQMAADQLEGLEEAYAEAMAAQAEEE